MDSVPPEVVLPAPRGLLYIERTCEGSEKAVEIVLSEGGTWVVRAHH